MIRQLILVLLITTQSAFAQTNIVGAFTGNQLQETIYLDFTIIAGQTCNGIIIERSTDSLNFYNIGDIAGVCGSISTPVRYNYIDSFPVANANNFYRLAPGNSDWSAVIKVYFKQHAENDFSIVPNPFNTSTTIRYLNPLRNVIVWRLFDINGKQMSEGSTKEDSFILKKNHLNTGLYFIQLTKDNEDFEKVKVIIE